MKEERSYGVIVFLKDKNRFLLLCHLDGHWGAPKGHKEKSETDKEAALRELKEETGITKIDLLDLPLIYEEYDFFRNGIKTHKINGYFVGLVEDEKVKIQEREIADYKWMTEQEIIEIVKHDSIKIVLKKVKEYLNLK